MCVCVCACVCVCVRAFVECMRNRYYAYAHAYIWPAVGLYGVSRHHSGGFVKDGGNSQGENLCSQSWMMFLFVV